MVFRRSWKMSQGATEPAPDFLPRDGDVHMSIGGCKNARGNAGGMIVARLLRHLTIDQPARGLEVEHECLRLQQRGVQPLPLPDFSRSSSASITPWAANNPAVRSAIGMPTRTGPCPGRPVIDIRPPIPCAT